MANSENTAVNELISRSAVATASTSPHTATIPRLPRLKRSAQATPPAQRLVEAGPMCTTIPMSMPVAAPFEARQPGLPTSYPVVPRALTEAPHQGIDTTGTQPWSPQVTGTAWFDLPRPADPGAGEHMVGTLQLHRRSELQRVLRRLALPMALLVLVGALLGAYVALDRGGKLRHRSVAASVASAAIAPVAAAVVPAPVAAPEVGPSEASPGSPALVDVRIDSTPSGATVMLVDRGRTQLVGNTPVVAAVDASREYDLVFTYASKPTQVEHLDPRTTRRVAVALDRRAAVARAGDDVPPAPVSRPDRIAAGSARGEGTLMISSKPPCAIVIDGKPTGLFTPQRSIALPAGIHTIALIHREPAVEKIITVQITANAAEKVIEDLMK